MAERGAVWPAPGGAAPRTPRDIFGQKMKARVPSVRQGVQHG